MTKKEGVLSKDYSTAKMSFVLSTCWGVNVHTRSSSRDAWSA